MKIEDILEQVNEIFIDTLDNDQVIITETTTANDVDEWDSLSHVNLVVAIEKTFGIKFKNSEILKWKNVGQMHDSIIEKLAEKA